MKAILRVASRISPVYVFSLSLMISMFVMQTQTPVAYAGEKSPYESGYDHGCDESKVSDPSDRYINQPEKGPSFHTDEFMNGYDDGYNACSSDDNSIGSNSNSLSRDKFRVTVTFIEGPYRNVDDARVYIQEYPQYGIPGGTDSSYIDLIDAFYNDAPYTGIWEDEITMPSDLVDVGIGTTCYFSQIAYPLTQG